MIVGHPGLMPRPAPEWTWEACQFPERPPDRETAFADNCPRCHLALRAALTFDPGPDRFRGWWEARHDLLPILEAWEARLEAVSR